MWCIAIVIHRLSFHTTNPPPNPTDPLLAHAGVAGSYGISHTRFSRNLRFEGTLILSIARDSTARRPDMRPNTTRTRDAALRRLAHANRWLLAASAALTGIFTAVAANAFPGKATKTTGTTGVARHSARLHAGSDASAGSTTSSSSSGSSSVQPPAEAPRSSATQEAAPSAGASSAAPAQEPAPSASSGEASSAAPAQESAPTKEAAPSGEASSGAASSVAPAQESSSAQQSSPSTAESAESTQSSSPVVSGGS
jgi:hypothetical protein